MAHLPSISGFIHGINKKISLEESTEPMQKAEQGASLERANIQSFPVTLISLEKQSCNGFFNMFFSHSLDKQSQELIA